MFVIMETLNMKLILHEIHIAPHKSTLIHSIGNTLYVYRENEMNRATNIKYMNSPK